MTFWKWSQTAGSNGNADSTINFAEGQAPSTLNDAGRGVMAAAAKYRDDTSGAIVTSGAVNAYTVSSYQGFDTLAHLHNQVVAFTPHITNTGASIMSIDGLGGKPLRPAPGVDFVGGELIQGTPYVGLYNNTNGEIYVGGTLPAGNMIPIGASLDYWGATAPNSAFALPIGQALSRATYAKLFSLIGTTYGNGLGDGLTFSLPDKTGRVSAMKEAVATRLTAGGGGVDGGTLGSAGGNQTKTLVTANLPPYTPAGSVATSISFGGGLGSAGGVVAGGANNVGFGGSATGGGLLTIGGNISAASTLTGTAQGGTSTPLPILPPLIVCNHIIRVL